MSNSEPSPVTLAVLMDPIEGLNVKKDTSLALLESAQNKGWALYYLTQEDLHLRDQRIVARVRPLHLNLSEAQWYRLGQPIDMTADSLDVLLMRKDPPFDMNYVYSTYMLERLEREGVSVVNRPQSLRDCNEKLFATWFPQCCPPLVVSADVTELKAFHNKEQDVIFKPLDGMGGTSIFRAVPGECNLNVILETLTEMGSRPIMGQRYLPEISSGDKRILMVDGEPIPFCLARIPSQGETRGNLAAGGAGEVRALTERDRWIASEVGPELKRRGLLFVGLDVIGDYLTEINVTSPTCVREIDRGAQMKIGDLLIDAIERTL